MECNLSHLWYQYFPNHKRYLSLQKQIKRGQIKCRFTRWNAIAIYIASNINWIGRYKTTSVKSIEKKKKTINTMITPYRREGMSLRIFVSHAGLQSLPRKFSSWLSEYNLREMAVCRGWPPPAVRFFYLTRGLLFRTRGGARGRFTVASRKKPR